ncbi:MAG: hypothetical protein MZW92_01735 [Comamonadaceae bacterium]|nr:hypothetical protein [Comamonadaceae bacterium]
MGRPAQARSRRSSPRTCAPAAARCGTCCAHATARRCAVIRRRLSRSGRRPSSSSTDVLRNVSVMDKGARESIVNFEKGVGDVAITYENEVLVGRKAGQPYEYVIPQSTILIENPVAVVDALRRQARRARAGRGVRRVRAHARGAAGVRRVRAALDRRGRGEGDRIAVPGGRGPLHHRATSAAGPRCRAAVRARRGLRPASPPASVRSRGSVRAAVEPGVGGAVRAGPASSPTSAMLVALPLAAHPLDRARRGAREPVAGGERPGRNRRRSL